jgi:Domain of unknown function (DUF4268)
MYSKAEASQLRQAFWTAFGQYLAPVPAASGEAIHWLNYRTGVKHVRFRIDADQHGAAISIDLTHPDAAIREVFFAQCEELRPALEEAVGEVWTWQPLLVDAHGHELARIGTTLAPANVFSRADWPLVISFLKPRLLALDAFWYNHQPLFEELL